jgi:hypothetical protein
MRRARANRLLGVMKRVMPEERRAQVIAIGSGQPATGGARLLLDGSLRTSGTRRMTREVHVPNLLGASG